MSSSWRVVLVENCSRSSRDFLRPLHTSQRLLACETRYLMSRDEQMGQNVFNQLFPRNGLLALLYDVILFQQDPASWCIARKCCSSDRRDAVVGRWARIEDASSSARIRSQVVRRRHAETFEGEAASGGGL